MCGEVASLACIMAVQTQTKGKEMTARQRRHVMIKELNDRRRETRGNFAAEFQVSLRTIDNDLVYLSEEYPVYTDRGRGGGIYVDKDFYLNQRYLSKAQKELLLRLKDALEGEDRRIMENILKTFGEKEDGR